MAAIAEHPFDAIGIEHHGRSTGRNPLGRQRPTARFVETAHQYSELGSPLQEGSDYGAALIPVAPRTPYSSRIIRPAATCRRW